MVIEFVLRKLKITILFGAILGTVLFLVFGKNIFVGYIMGLIVGCMNFALLAIGMNLIVSNRLKRVRIVQFLFFTFRYLLIAYVLIESIRTYNINIFAAAGGLLTNNAVLAVFAFKKHFSL